jgi:hypothetical protein
VGNRPNPADWPAYLDEAKLMRFLEGYRKVADLGEGQLGVLVDLMVETMIAEAVLPVAAAGFFANVKGSEFLAMIRRKAEWLAMHRRKLEAGMLGEG